MEKNWQIKNSTAINSAVAALHKELAADGRMHSQLILQILFARGLRTKAQIESFFDFDYEKGILDPFQFPDMAKAVARIMVAKEKKEKVAIFGDYDADGVTSSALVFEALTDLGFPNVEVYIPDRQLEGYGMNKEAVEYLSQQGVTLIITVDCGVTGIAEVALAQEKGIDVIVTDHHHAPAILPAAVAVINPHIENCGYACQDLAGVGVAFKLVQALYQKMDPKNVDQLKWFLDLVAIGTVADCVPLLEENRVLVKYGLIVLSKTRRVGLLEMFKVGRIVIDENNVPDTQKIAFQISPRINAAGRMDHASFSYNLMVEKDRVKARTMALEVEDKNQKRQKMTAEIVKEVKAIAEEKFADKNLIFAASENWRVGILGLIAGKIADEYAKPTAVFQEQNGECVGSFRSIPEINIIEALEKCADLLMHFGGHAQAAGVRLKKENLETFYARLLALIDAQLQGEKKVPEIEVDAEITAADINWELMLEMKQLEPFGQGNEEPIFLLKKMCIEDLKVVGNGSKHIKLSLRAQSNSPKIFDSIGFGLGDKFPDLKKGDLVDILFNLQEDEWNGNKKMQLRLIDLKLRK